MQEAFDYYLDKIETETLGYAERQRQQKLAELSSIDAMAVELLVSGYQTAANKEAYLRALSSSLVRVMRSRSTLPLEAL